MCEHVGGEIRTSKCVSSFYPIECLVWKRLGTFKFVNWERFGTKMFQFAHPQGVVVAVAMESTSHFSTMHSPPSHHQICSLFNQ